jgi:large subunit ribosomal protein L3
MGIIAYKAGMATAIVRDKTDKSMTLNKKIALPVTILEVPNLKIYSVRFYKHGKVMKEVVVSHDKELKRVVRVPKQPAHALPEVHGWDEIRVIVYSVTKDLYKKTPTMSEIALRMPNALEFVKTHLGKEIQAHDIITWNLVDVRGLTKGKGLSGPVKRFGISLKSHKSEKGVRRPGSLGPWHPAHVTFRVAMAGQLGMFSRIHYNLPLLFKGKVGDHIPTTYGFKHYGSLGGSYVVISGSVQGAAKREILITAPLRPTKKQLKKKFEFLELKL